MVKRLHRYYAESGKKKHSVPLLIGSAQQAGRLLLICRSTSSPMSNTQHFGSAFPLDTASHRDAVPGKQVSLAIGLFSEGMVMKTGPFIKPL